MPFKSEKQRKYLWANEPAIARDWTDTYGSRIQKNSGGISQLVKPGPGRPGYAGYLDRNIANLQAALKYSDLTPEQRAQAEKDLKEALANKGGWEDKTLGGDPVPESRMSPEQRGAIREMMAARSGDYSGLGPHRGMPLSAEDRQAYLAELLANDPASSLYDLSTVKDFSEEENRGRKARMSKGVEGYYSDGTAYVKDLDKLGTRVGPFKDSLADQKLAAIASHELTHPKVEKYNIDMSNIEEPRELPTDGYLHDRTYMPHEKEELLTRMIEMQNFPKTSDAEWYFGQSPYAISKHPSGAEGYEAGKILQRSLEPSLQKYNQLIEAEKRLGLASIKPQTKNWSVFDDNEARDIANREFAANPTFQTSEEEEEYNEYLRSIGQMPTIKDPNIFQRAIGGIRGGINRANEYNRSYNRVAPGANTNYYAGSLHGNIDNAARVGRRNQGRVNNLIARNIQGKKIRKDASSFINRFGTPQQKQNFADTVARKTHSPHANYTYWEGQGVDKADITADVTGMYTDSGSSGMDDIGDVTAPTDSWSDTGGTNVSGWSDNDNWGGYIARGGMVKDAPRYRYAEGGIVNLLPKGAW